MTRSMLTTSCLGLFLLGVAGCQQSLYDWGSYESSLLRMYSPGDRYEPQHEIARLTEEIEKTKRKNELVPPGKRLHLGYLFYMTGDTDSTRRWFEEEKAAFPESETFVDGLLSRMK